jgi:hypothetical protein
LSSLKTNVQVLNTSLFWTWGYKEFTVPSNIQRGAPKIAKLVIITMITTVYGSCWDQQPTYTRGGHHIVGYHWLTISSTIAENICQNIMGV